MNPYKLTEENWAMFKSLVYAEDSPTDDGWMNKVVEDLFNYPEHFEFFYQRRKIELLAMEYFKANSIKYNPDYPAKSCCAFFNIDNREYGFSVDFWLPTYSIWTIIKKESSWDQAAFDQEIDHLCTYSQPPLRRGIDDSNGKPYSPIFILEQLCITPEEFRLQFPYSIKAVQEAVKSLYHHFSPEYQAQLERFNKRLNKAREDDSLPF